MEVYRNAWNVACNLLAWRFLAISQRVQHLLWVGESFSNSTSLEILSFLWYRILQMLQANIQRSKFVRQTKFDSIHFIWIMIANLILMIQTNLSFSSMYYLFSLSYSFMYIPFNCKWDWDAWLRVIWRKMQQKNSINLTVFIWFKLLHYIDSIILVEYDQWIKSDYDHKEKNAFCAIQRCRPSPWACFLMKW